MKKTIKGILLLVCISVVLVSCGKIDFNITDNSEETVAEETVAEEMVLVKSGKCGDDVDWEIYSNGFLSITGYGEMQNLVDGDDDWVTEYSNGHITWNSDYRTNELVKNVVIGNGVTTVSGKGFYKCENMEQIELPDTIELIGYGAFTNCSNLKAIDIPNKVYQIGTEAFYGCKLLSEISIPEGVSSIAGRTFGNCENLKSITIPSSVKEIRKDAFMGCDNLQDVYYGGSKEDWQSIRLWVGNDDLRHATVHYNSY